MKVLITGGHLTPALAIIQKLPKDVDVVYVGRKYPLLGDTAVSLESQTISKLGISFIAFHPARLQRKFTHHTIPSLGRIPKDIFSAFHILRKEHPDVVLSFGGHVALSFGIAASILKIPLIIHEQTLEVGVTNKFLAKFATKICVSWESSKKFFPKDKVVVTGNPIPESHPSREIKELLAKAPRKYPLLTITGGSLGSHAINVLVEPILEKLLATYTVVHQTGDSQEFGDFKRLEDFKHSLPYTFQERYVVQKFIAPTDVAYMYSLSDVVISRSGINTVLMLLVENIPAILIPLPFSQRHEQQKNAQFFKDAGLGVVLTQQELTPVHLLAAITHMMEKRKTYINVKSKQLGNLHAHAADAIINIVYDTQNHNLSKKI